MSIFGDSTPEVSNRSSPVGSFVEDDRHNHHQNAVDSSSAHVQDDFHTLIEDELEREAITDDAEIGLEEHQFDQNFRPNRFEGTAAQWKRLTAEERHLATSLDLIRASDLSGHLYNAYTLKRKAGQLDKEHGTEEDYSNGKKQAAWKPSAKWTAWPMPPELVPTSAEHFGIPTEDPLMGKNPFTANSKLTDDLREQLQATLQRHAKTCWAADGGKINPREEETAPDQVATVDRRLAVLSDEDKAREILHPTVNSVLAKLDQLLLALHRSRRGFTQAAQSNREHRDMVPQEKRVREDPGPSVRSRTQSRSRSNSTSASVERSRSTGGRPRIYDKRADESYYHMHKRRAQERSISPDGGNRTASEGLQKSHHTDVHTPFKHTAIRTQNQQSHEAGDEAEDVKANAPLPHRGLRDWSQVLGMASQQRFSDVVVRRAAKRCGELFNESMSLCTTDTGTTTKVVNTSQDFEETDLQATRQQTLHRRRKRYRAATEAERNLCCPVQDCLWHRKRFAALRHRNAHVLEAHGPDVLAESALTKVIVDGVHLDGFLQVMDN